VPKKIKKRGKVFIEHGLASRVKMSEVLEEYARPLLEEATDLNSIQVAIEMASICWNIASMPEDKQEELMRDALAEISKISGDYETSQKIMDMLIKRKKMFFPKYNKFILNKEVVPLEKGGYYLTVLSTEI
jgi:hypothetical protein